MFGFLGMWLLSLRHLWCLKGYWCWYDDDVFERILKGGGEVEVDEDEDEVVEEVKKL